MKYSEASKLALRLRHSGGSIELIAATLATKGYRSQRTGKPLTLAGVAHMLWRAEKKKKVSVRGSGEGVPMVYGISSSGDTPLPNQTLMFLKQVLKVPTLTAKQKLEVSKVLLSV